MRISDADSQWERVDFSSVDSYESEDEEVQGFLPKIERHVRGRQRRANGGFEGPRRCTMNPKQVRSLVTNIAKGRLHPWWKEENDKLGMYGTKPILGTTIEEVIYLAILKNPFDCSFLPHDPETTNSVSKLVSWLSGPRLNAYVGPLFVGRRGFEYSETPMSKPDPLRTASEIGIWSWDPTGRRGASDCQFEDMLPGQYSVRQRLHEYVTEQHRESHGAMEWTSKGGNLFQIHNAPILYTQNRLTRSIIRLLERPEYKVKRVVTVGHRRPRARREKRVTLPRIHPRQNRAPKRQMSFVKKKMSLGVFPAKDSSHFQRGKK